jgi:hypothetical protein
MGDISQFHKPQLFFHFSEGQRSYHAATVVCCPLRSALGANKSAGSANTSILQCSDLQGSALLIVIRQTDCCVRTSINNIEEK